MKIELKVRYVEVQYDHIGYSYVECFNENFSFLSLYIDEEINNLDFKKYKQFEFSRLIRFLKTYPNYEEQQDEFSD